MAYRDTAMAVAYLLGMMGLILAYRLYAPRLHRLAGRYHFISVGDFIHWRYRSARLVAIINVIILLIGLWTDFLKNKES